MTVALTDPNQIWIDHAERLLFDIAIDLRRTGTRPEAVGLHLRALELKRTVSRWRDRPPDPPARDATLGAIEHLADEVTRTVRGRAIPDATPAT